MVGEVVANFSAAKDDFREAIGLWSIGEGGTRLGDDGFLLIEEGFCRILLKPVSRSGPSIGDLWQTQCQPELVVHA